MPYQESSPEGHTDWVAHEPIHIPDLARSGFLLPLAEAYVHELLMPLMKMKEGSPYLRSNSIIYISGATSSISRPVESMVNLSGPYTRMTEEEKDCTNQRTDMYKAILPALYAWIEPTVSDDVRAVALVAGGSSVVRLAERYAERTHKTISFTNPSRRADMLGAGSKWQKKYEEILKPEVHTYLGLKTIEQGFLLWKKMGIGQDRTWNMAHRFFCALDAGGRSRPDSFYQYLHGIVRMTQWEKEV